MDFNDSLSSISFKSFDHFDITSLITIADTDVIKNIASAYIQMFDLASHSLILISGLKNKYNIKMQTLVNQKPIGTGVFLLGIQFCDVNNAT